MNERLCFYNRGYGEITEFEECYRDFTMDKKPSLKKLNDMADSLAEEYKCYIEVESVIWNWINIGVHGYARVIFLIPCEEDRKKRYLDEPYVQEM